MEENKCVICGGPLGENTIPSEMLEGDICLEAQPPREPCEFLDKALVASVHFKCELNAAMEEFEDMCMLHTPFNIRRNNGLRVIDCGHLPAVRAAMRSLQAILDEAIANPGGQNVQE